MNAGESGAVGPAGIDRDLLADYAGGALDGTPQAADVAARIATDPAWAAAYEALRTADTAVRANLSALGAEHPAMPAPVAARLQAALEGAGSVIPLAAHRRRRARRAGIAAVAAGLVVIAAATGGAIINAQRDDGKPGSSSLADGGGRAEAPAAASSPPSDSRQSDKNAGRPGEAAPSAAAPVTVVASGTDYSRTTLAGATSKQPDVSTNEFASRVPAELRRLVTELSGCLALVRRSYQDLEPSLADFARFEGEAAVVIVLRRPGAAAARIVVVGPDCGLTGTDERYSVPV